METIKERNWVAETLTPLHRNARIAQPKVVGSVGPWDESREIAKFLDLSAQAERYTKMHVGEITEVFASVRLEGNELEIWRYYCPTTYREADMSNYSFDTIPLSILKYWKEVKEKYAFDGFEIWTTERPRIIVGDPLLIGIYGGIRYLLARWGKETSVLLPFAEVRTRVYTALCNFDLSQYPPRVVDVFFDLQERYGPMRIMGGKELTDVVFGSFFSKRHCGRKVQYFHFTGNVSALMICPACGHTSEADPAITTELM